MSELEERLGFPLVVKPSRGGSALGVKFAASWYEVPEALVSAFVHCFEMRGYIFRFGNVIGGRGTHGVVVDLLKKLGKFRSSVSCIYIKKLEDIDRKVLEQLARKSVADTLRRYPSR